MGINPLFDMASITNFSLGLFDQDRVFDLVCTVTGRTRSIRGVMLTASPIYPDAALMAVQTNFILLFDRSWRADTEDNSREGPLGGSFDLSHMLGTGTVTAFAFMQSKWRALVC